MEPVEILAELGKHEGLAVEAIRAARADRAAMVPVFLQAFEQYLSAGGDHAMQDALFLAFHLLGEWREKSAYRPLARLLRSPRADEFLGDAATETVHRVVAAVFDGDPTPLFEIIRDPYADEYVRSRICEAVAMLVLRGEIRREDAAQFLRTCYSGLEPQDECFVWQGWQSAIALLGLEELRSLVQEAFERGFISPDWLAFKHFEEDLRHGMRHPGAPPLVGPRNEYTLFGDTIEEFSTWAFAEPRESERPERRGQEAWFAPVTNPQKGVGRNDPCPCGSGKKFKKCCLNAQRDAAARTAA
jgi:hypothetical protein